MSAQLDADLVKAIADITAVKTDAAADANSAATALANAQAALAAAQASDTADKALAAQLTAVLKARGFNPDGTPISVTPPPATPTFGPATFDATAKIVTVPFANVVPAKIGRNGTDSTGFGPWDTSLTPNSLAGFITAGKATFTGMNVPGATFTFTLTPVTGSPMTCAVTIPGVTPPVVVPPVVTGTGKVRLGVYHFGFGSIDGSFDRALGVVNLTRVAHIYWDMADGSFNGDFLGAGGYGAWAAADKAHRQILVGMSPLTDEPGNFASARVRQRCRDFAAYIKAKATQYGFNPEQVLWRFGYEANGDWMPWGKQFDASGAGYRQMANDCKAIARAAIPACTWVQCFTPWDNGAASFASWVLSGTDWEASADTYDDYEGGLGQASIDAHVNRGALLADWCDAHGVFWAGYDEVAVCSTGDGAGGAGDNPAFITATFALVVRRGKGPNVRYTYFDVNVQETSTTISQNPNSAKALAVAATAAAA